MRLAEPVLKMLSHQVDRRWTLVEHQGQPFLRLGGGEDTLRLTDMVQLASEEVRAIVIAQQHSFTLFIYSFFLLSFDTISCCWPSAYSSH